MKKVFLLVLGLVAVLSQLAAELTVFDNYTRGGRPLLIPDVQQYRAGEGGFRLPQVLTVSVPAGEELITEQLAGELKRFGAVKVLPGGEKAVCRFVLGGAGAPEHPQGYRLTVDANGIVVVSRSAAGLFYGAQTLRNLLRNAAEPVLANCVITDWPDFDERSYTIGIRSSKTLPQVKRLLDVLSGLKMNHICLSTGSSFPLSDNPLTLRKNAFTREELSDLMRFCTRRHIAVTPIIPVFSHAQWMTTHPDWPKMREDRAKPRSYKHNSQPCPLDPEVRKLVEKMLTEQIEFFRAKSVYITVDEIYLCPFRECEKCRQHSPEELLRDYLGFVYGVLEKHGVAPMVCQDSYLKSGRWPYGEYMRGLLPRNAIIRWWDYHDELPERYMAPFKGFELSGTGLSGKPLNVWNMARLVKKYGGKGCGMTHWYYGSGGVFSILKHSTPDNLGGFVNGADQIWKMTDTPYPHLGYDGTFEMMRRLYPETTVEVPRGRVAEPVPLEDQVNAELSGSGVFPRFADDAALDELKAALGKLPERFRLVTSPGGKYYALRLTGKGKGRRAIAIPFGDRKADMLSFLLTASRPRNAMSYHCYLYGKKRFTYDPAATLTVEYADGATEKTMLRYRREITDWNRPFGGFGMRWAVRGVDADKNYYTFGIYDFKNPHPEKAIRSIIFATKMLDGVSPALLALSRWGDDVREVPAGAPFDPAALKGRIGVGRAPAPKWNIRADFEHGMGAAYVNCHATMKDALKYEIVRDPDSIDGSHVLKITIPPGKYGDPENPSPLLRVSVDLPFRIDKKDKCFTVDVKFTADLNDYARVRGVVLDHDLAYPGTRTYRGYKLSRLQPPRWRRFTFPLEQHSNREEVMKDILDGTFGRVIFFLYRELRHPVEIRIDNIGTALEDVSTVPPWKENGEAEPI